MRQPLLYLNMRNCPIDLNQNEMLVGSNMHVLLGFSADEHMQCLNAAVPPFCASFI